jgi:hypothetical protein
MSTISQLLMMEEYRNTSGISIRYIQMSHNTLITEKTEKYKHPSKLTLTNPKQLTNIAPNPTKANSTGKPQTTANQLPTKQQTFFLNMRMTNPGNQNNTKDNSTKNKTTPPSTTTNISPTTEAALNST